MIPVADGVYVHRHTELDLTTGLVLGEKAALVIDTAGDRAQGAALADAVRELTPLPLIVAITHAHFDHCFGTGAFPGAPVHAHPGCIRALAATAADQRAEWTAYYRARAADRTTTGVTPEARAAAAATAAALSTTAPPLPDHPLPRGGVTLDLGGRSVQLLHPGRGHTDHDLVVLVPDARVLFAGDLVEQGAPPSAGPDACTSEWPATVDRLLGTGADLVVPGHGDPLDREAVMAQREELAVRARDGELPGDMDEARR